MSADLTELFSSELPWPKGAVQDWEQGWSYGDLAKKYGRSYSSIVQQIRRAKELGATRAANLHGRRKGGTKKYIDQPAISPAHSAVGIKLNRYREVEKGINLDEMGKLVKSNRMVARKMELGIHDFKLSELTAIGALLEQPIEDLIKPASARN